MYKIICHSPIGIQFSPLEAISVTYFVYNFPEIINRNLYIHIPVYKYISIYGKMNICEHMYTFLHNPFLKLY